jgi:glycosyltransferase involved in cell wall biosynthesis
MNILMMTNTYTPIVGGLERSVKVFSDEFRKRGHKVLIITPEFDDMPQHEDGVIRIPAIKHFNHTEYSVKLPIPGLLKNILDEFKPDIVHSHFPYLIGDTAMRVAAKREIPLIFTFHSLYEKYTHYVPGDSIAMKRFALALSIGYANLCDYVIAPSESMIRILKQRGVIKPLTVIPTGIYPAKYQNGDGLSIRKEFHIPRHDFVIGYYGRIEKEKNIDFLAEVIGEYMQKNKHTHFLLVGKGSKADDIKYRLWDYRVGSRVHATGVLHDQRLTDSYYAADVFAFSSLSETQGIVLAEAMACGLPIVAIDAPGSRDIIKDTYNGRLIPDVDKHAFLDALDWLHQLSETDRQRLKDCARKTALAYTMDECVNKVLDVYQHARHGCTDYYATKDSAWGNALKKVKVEWDIMVNMARATSSAMNPRRSSGEDVK